MWFRCIVDVVAEGMHYIRYNLQLWLLQHQHGRIHFQYSFSLFAVESSSCYLFTTTVLQVCNGMWA